MADRRRFTPEHDYDVDANGTLAYWCYVVASCQLLEPASIIQDSTMIIGKLGQQNLLPDHLTLKPKDLETSVICDRDSKPIGNVPPGISTFLFWGSPTSQQHKLNSLSESHTGTPATKKNRVYIASVGDILTAGWNPYFAPLIEAKYNFSNPLHVLLVPHSIEKSGVLADATHEEKNALASVFIRWAIDQD